MHAQDIAALIAAGAFVALVLLLAYPLIKLGRTLDEATLAIRGTYHDARPVLTQAQEALASVNSQLGEVDIITREVSVITANLAHLTAILTSTITTPLIKLAALSYGLRSAVRRRQRTGIDSDAHRPPLLDSGQPQQR